jgi:hypothetical protein
VPNSPFLQIIVNQGFKNGAEGPALPRGVAEFHGAEAAWDIPGVSRVPRDTFFSGRSISQRSKWWTERTQSD